MSDFEKIFADANAAYQEQDFVLSAKLLHQIIDARPLFAPAYNLLADIYYQTGLKDEALKYYKECITIVPKDNIGYVGAAKVLCDFAKYDDALNLCNQAFYEDDNLNLNKARAYFGLQDYPKAKSILKKLSKNNLLAKACLAEVFLEEGDYHKTVDLCDSILEKEPRFFKAHILKAKVFYRIERFELSLECYRQALNIDPYNIDVLLEISEVLLILGKNNESFSNLKLALENAKDDASIVAKIALLIYEQGFVDEAFAVLEDAFVKMPENSNINIAIGHLLLAEESQDIITICRRLKQAISNQDLTEKDFVVIYNQILTMLPNDKEGIVKELIDFWLELNPFDTLVIHLKNIVNQQKIEACELSYLKRFYNYKAENYKYESDIENITIHKNFAEILSNSVFANKNNCFVLDVGCGLGSLAELLKPVAMAEHFYGIDISLKMLEHSKKLAIYDNLQNIEVSKFLESTYDFFDLIVADGILQTKGNIIPVFKDLTKALVLGGHLLFTVNIHNTKDDFMLACDGLFRHSASYIKKIISDFDVELVLEKGFSYQNNYNELINGRSYLVKKTFL